MLAGFEDHHRARGNHCSAGREDHLQRLALLNIAVGDIIHRAKHRRFRPLHHRRHRLGVGSADYHAVLFQIVKQLPGLVAHAVLQPDQQIQRRAGERRVGGCHLVFKRRLGEIPPLFRFRGAAFTVPDNTQGGDALGDIVRRFQVRRYLVGVGARKRQQPAPLVQIFGGIPRGGDQHIRLRVGLLGLQSGHHFAGGGLKNGHLHPGLLFKTAGQAFRQRAGSGGVNGQRMGAGEHHGGESHREYHSFLNGHNGVHATSPEVGVTARTAATRPADK